MDVHVHMHVPILLDRVEETVYLSWAKEGQHQTRLDPLPT